jgi:hypothetical protein
MRLLRPPHIGIFPRSFRLHGTHHAREMIEEICSMWGRPRYGDHYSDRLLGRLSSLSLRLRQCLWIGEASAGQRQNAHADDDDRHADELHA